MTLLILLDELIELKSLSLHLLELQLRWLQCLQFGSLSYLQLLVRLKISLTLKLLLHSKLQTPSQLFELSLHLLLSFIFAREFA
jgi:hypothetical protein